MKGKSTEDNQMKTDGVWPFELLVANDAVVMCEKLESDFRNKGDCCHNNIGSKTSDDWEQMDKFLVDAADEIRSVHDCVKSLVTLYSRQKLRNCDVGTAEEQLTRYIAECRLHHCNNCPLGNNQRECGIYWSQMPYEADEGGAE